jgi:hypothetical protein
MADEPKPTGNDQDTTPNEGGNEKTFTQAELDKIVGERLARERKNQPDPEKLKKFEEWEKSQQSEAEKAAETAKKLADAQSEAEQLRRENAVIKAGVSADDADYVMFKVGKMEGDFNDNLKKFLEDNKKYTTEPTKKVPDNKHDPSKSDEMDGVEAAFRRKNPDLKYD